MIPISMQKPKQKVETGILQWLFFELLGRQFFFSLSMELG